MLVRVGCASLLSLALGCGSSVALASGLQDAAALTSDGVSLYWIENGPPAAGGHGGNGALRKMPIAGGPITTLARDLGTAIGGPAQDLALPLGGLKLSSGNLYWWGYDLSTAPPRLQLFTLPASGGVPAAVPGALGAGELLIAFDVLERDVFVELATQTSFILRRIPTLAPTARKDLFTQTWSGDPSVLAPYDQFGELVATAGGLFLKKVDRTPSAPPVTSLYRRALGDDPTLPLVPIAQGVTAARLVADDRSLYWVQAGADGTDQLIWLALDGAMPTAILARPRICLTAITAAAVLAFDCAQPAPGPDKWTLLAVPLQGGPARTLITDDGSALSSLIASGSVAYWLEQRPPRPIGRQPITWDIRTAR